MPAEGHADNTSSLRPEAPRMRRFALLQVGLLVDIKLEVSSATAASLVPSRATSSAAGADRSGRVARAAASSPEYRWV